MDKSTLRSELINKEQYYLYLYKPVYNFSLTAGAPNTLGSPPEAQLVSPGGVNYYPLNIGLLLGKELQVDLYLLKQEKGLQLPNEVN